MNEEVAAQKRFEGAVFGMATVVVLAVIALGFYVQHKQQAEQAAALDRVERAIAETEALLPNLPADQAARIRDVIAEVKLKIMLNDAVGAEVAARQFEELVRTGAGGGQQGGGGLGTNYPGDQEVIGPDLPR